LERDLEIEQGDDYILDLKKNFDLAVDEHKYDVIPEIWEGHNIADYIDPDIEKKLAELEREEQLREEAGLYDDSESEEDEKMAEIRTLAQAIRDRKAILRVEGRVRKHSTKPHMPRTTRAKSKERSLSRFKTEMGRVGLDLETSVRMDMDDSTASEPNYIKQTRGRTRSRSLVVQKRRRLDSAGNDDSMETDESVNRRQRRSLSQSKTRSTSLSLHRNARNRSSSKPRDEQGVPDQRVREKIRKMTKKTQNVKIGRAGKRGEADRAIPAKKPKHLFAGKRKGGKTQRR